MSLHKYLPQRQDLIILCQCHDLLHITSWIKSLFWEIELEIPKMPLFCNNQGAIFLATNPAVEGCSKHINIHEHYICECVERSNKLDLYIMGPNH